MAKYLLIESRDVLEATSTKQQFSLAAGLAARGNDVTLYLVENGVFAARKGPASSLSEAKEAGVNIVADGFSLKERGIADGELGEGISSAEVELIVDRLAAGAKSIWH